MDPNIDPSIESQSLFPETASPSSPTHGSNTQPMDANQQYLDLQQQSHHKSQLVAQVAAAAQQQQQQYSNAFRLNDLSPTPLNVFASYQNQTTNDHQHATSTPDLTADPFAQAQLSEFQTPPMDPSLAKLGVSERANAKQEHDSSSMVNFVPFDPASKVKRLGRPRRNKNINTPTPENSSSQNYNEAVLSKFRFDEKPVVGPGSRGGRGRQRSKPRGKILSSYSKRQKQAHLFVPKGTEDADGAIKLGLNTETTEQDGVSKPTNDGVQESVRSDEDADGDVSDITRGPSAAAEARIILEDYDSLKSKGRSTAREDKLLDHSSSTPSDIALMDLKEETPEGTSSPISKLGLQPDTAKKTRKRRKFTKDETSLPPRQRRRKELPGPLLPLYFDYNAALTKEELNDSYKLCLGYKVTPSPFANDIGFLVLYLTKFREFFRDLPNLGPQDFEEGLSLNVEHIDDDFLLKYNHENVNVRAVEKEEHDDYISPVMEQLFWKLLTLVLNRKKQIDRSSQLKAIQDLKNSMEVLGYPQEWRSDTSIFSSPKPALQLDPRIVQRELEKGPVDESMPEFFDSMQYIYSRPEIIPDNPLNTEEFSANGLSGMASSDRMTLLKALAQWSLSSSDSIRSVINSKTLSQDPSGEKETLYVARSVMEGKEGVQSAIKEANDIIKKKQQRKLEYQQSKGTGAAALNMDETDLGKYVEANSDPLKHPMNFRVLENFAGDLGSLGRFYFVRMWDSKTGSLASLNDMIHVWKSNEVGLNYELPSKFKLYVQDVNSMLERTLKIECTKTDTADPLLEEDIITFDPWYEVATNVEELDNFVGFLAAKLGYEITKEPIEIIEPTEELYNQVKNLHSYLSSILPLLEKQEAIEVKPIRSSRKKQVEYNEVKNDKKLKNLTEEEFKDDMYVEQDDDADEDYDDPMEVEEGGDDDDDDYRE